MPSSMTVDEIVAAIKELGEEDRQALLLQLAQIDDLIEDLEDIADMLRSRNEPGRPFEEFLAEMRAEGRDV